MVKATLGLAGAVFLAAASPAGAQAFNGADKIVRGDYAAAERELRGQQALYPDRVDLLLNLAATYMATGRMAEARRAYQRVSAQPDQEVILRKGGAAWSHALATQGLARGYALVASR